MSDQPEADGAETENGPTDPAGRRHALLLTAGGLLAVVLPATVLLDPRLLGLFIAVPPLLAYGPLELRRRYGQVLGRTGHAGIVLLAACFAAWLFGTLLLTTRPLDFLGVAGGVLLLGVGAAAAIPGSGLLALALWRRRAVPRPLALALGGAPLLPAVLGLLQFLFPTGVPVALSLGVAGLALELYWLAWVALGVRLYRAASDEPERLRLSSARA